MCLLLILQLCEGWGLEVRFSGVMLIRNTMMKLTKCFLECAKVRTKAGCETGSSSYNFETNFGKTHVACRHLYFGLTVPELLSPGNSLFG